MSRNIKIIPTEDGLKIESRIPVDRSFVNKINNPLNKDRINAQLKDMRCTHHIEVQNGTTSVITFCTYEEKTKDEFDTMIKVISSGHDAFIENVTLRMVEVDATPQDPQDVDKNYENRKFVKKVLDEWDETETRMGTAGAVILGKDSTLELVMPCGHISEKLLKQMFETWSKEYDK